MAGPKPFRQYSDISTLQPNNFFKRLMIFIAILFAIGLVFYVVYYIATNPDANDFRSFFVSSWEKFKAWLDWVIRSN
jgi:hypothetical protein